MKVLAIEPYWGGSHKAFLEGWVQHSRHEWELITLPPYKWKWRMRHSALTCARETAMLLSEGKSWDIIFGSDMLGLAEYAGLCPPSVASLPRVAYFHENQLLYPDRGRKERDMHFPYTNFTSCLAANQVWFNTNWHREGFLHEMEKLLKRMPDYGHPGEIDRIREQSLIMPQGIHQPPERAAQREPGPMRLVWAARWEHDKNAGDLYGALSLIREKGIDFQLSVIGESFRDVPKVFGLIREEFAPHILRWGFQESRQEYYDALLEADYFISTAEHEFFGVSLMEAASCGTVPLAPDRLAYPEVLRGYGDFIYGTTARDLAAKLTEISGFTATPEWDSLSALSRRIAKKYFWQKLAPKLDEGLEKVRC